MGVLLFAAVLLPWFVGGSSATADDNDNDKFDGAVWSFSMTSKQPEKETLRGRFRVNNHVLFQKPNPQGEFDKEIGTSNPKGRGRTRLELHDVTAFTKGRSPRTGLTGKVWMTIDRFGEWSGKFIDSEGRHWDFKCSRIQE